MMFNLEPVGNDFTIDKPLIGDLHPQTPHIVCNLPIAVSSLHHALKVVFRWLDDFTSVLFHSVSRQEYP